MTNGEQDAVVDEYDALRSGGGIVELADWSSVTITGRDRQMFLHNFCTNDVKRLLPGASCEGFVTNVKGKIVGHGLITCRDDELVLCGAPDQGPRLVEHLDRYVIREDVKVRDTTAERAYLFVSGERNKCVDLMLPHLEYAAAVQAPFAKLSEFPALYEQRPVYFCGWFKPANQFALLLETTTADVATLKGMLIASGFETVDRNAFESLRIETSVPLFGIDFDEQNFPQEVGRDAEAISFTKGCYLGQETVARIDALGHVNQRIVGVRFFGGEVPSRGTELSLADAKVGRVTSATFSRKLSAPLALAMVRREANAPGMRLDSPVSECEVIALPLPMEAD